MDNKKQTSNQAFKHYKTIHFVIIAFIIIYLLNRLKEISDCTTFYAFYFFGLFIYIGFAKMCRGEDAKLPIKINILFNALKLSKSDCVKNFLIKIGNSDSKIPLTYRAIYFIFPLIIFIIACHYK